MDYIYAKGWFRAKKRPLKLLSTGVAKTLHESGKPYTVLAGGHLPDRPKLFIDVNLGTSWVGVTFLDDELRPFVDYSFASSDGEQLFLERAVYREFPVGCNDPTASVHYFKTNGSYIVEDSDQSDTVQCRESANPTDVSSNWEPIPEFGQYDSVARLER